MTTLVIVLHVIVCVILILVVLLQAGKGADMGATFGAGSSQTVFGSGGAAPFLTKLTTGVAVIFMVTSIGLTILSARESKKSVIQDIPQTSESKVELPPTNEPKKQDASKP